MKRKQNFQPIAWFWDLHKRERLDLDPPYQRRSVWTQTFKDYFIDTILLNYPVPAVFLHEDISLEGVAKYHVVDGKQRLTAIFEFLEGSFPVPESAERTSLRGKYWQDLDDETKRDFWSFQFSVEYLPTVEDSIISNIFNRINKNTARLTAQELRHAKYGGIFIEAAESLARWVSRMLPPNFPNIAASSRKQMKEVEFVAELLLLLELGPRASSTDSLDAAFAERDLDWEESDDVVARFEDTVKIVNELVTQEGGEVIRSSRLKNQTDFYSLFGGIADLKQQGTLPKIPQCIRLLRAFVERIDKEDERAKNTTLSEYYDAARSASNDAAQRRKRIDTIKDILKGRVDFSQEP